FTVKEITCIVRLSNDDPTKIIYLKVKAFVPLNDTSNHYIESFSPGDVVFLKGKFIGSENFYIVTATSIKVINFEFDNMPVLGINSVIIGITNQTVKNIENDLIFEFYIEEKVRNCEPSSFWIEARHNANNKYLTNKQTR
ncbi:7215_t:CDS:2, partial [Gigaspora margarita]